MSITEGVELNVTRAHSIEDFVLEVAFSDETSQRIDFEPFLSGSDQPEIRKYLDEDRFKAFEISYGNLVWNDYDLCFSIEDLYSGCLIANEAKISKVAENTPDYQVGE